MRTRKQTAASGIVVNVLIITMIAALYFSTSSDVMVPAAAADVFYAPPIYRGQADDAVALQFAVDYQASALEDILDTLSQNDIKLTFAVSGKWARDNAKLLKRIVDEGHEVATMGNDHSSDGNLSWVVSDVEKSLDTVELISGTRPTLYYSGEYRSIPVSSYAAEKLDLTQVLCTVDLLCARGSSADIIQRFEKVCEPSSIILAQPTKAMSESLDDIIKILKSKGLSVTTVSDIL
ncbi:MAG: polysaccharide deacetylase family protein [Clostridia bacterium]|nr:polysaccharide deacetylase family protein [Clostridia bacterium]